MLHASRSKIAAAKAAAFVLLGSTIFANVQLPVAFAAPPLCNGVPATVYVEAGFVVGGPNDGDAYVAGVTEIKGGTGPNVIAGTAAGDLLRGNSARDIICGGEGNDDIEGASGDDDIYGEGGDDFISGGAGEDKVFGGPGNDTLEGNSGVDIICGAGDNDNIEGGGGDDQIDANGGIDSIIGNTGSNDRCLGGETLATCEIFTGSVPECGPGSTCGNGIIEAPETCDDGNVTPGDGCSATCQTSTQCGDGVDSADAEDTLTDSADPGCHTDGDASNGGSYDPADNDESNVPACQDGVTQGGLGETCDDGNPTNGDGCDSLCHTEVCGNGFTQTGETCDDGNLVNGDGCSSTCQIESVCGNGILQPPEQCDDGNLANADGCDNLCHIEVCGNGFVQSGETCDDGNLVNGDGCSSICQTSFQCSDSVENADPEDVLMDLGDPGCYDNGNTVTGTYVPGDNDETHVPACGNGAIDQLSEVCDDGNLVNGDGCSNTCQTTVQCSDTVDNADPEDTLLDTGDPGCYDNGNTVTGTYVPGDNDETHVPACGNGALDQLSEQCDDGNVVNGDGCSSTCQTSFQCSDTVDNTDPEDTLLDTGDPGCYDNGNVVTGVYGPTDNNEVHVPACGNGAIDQLSEACDDGNLVNGDGCSSICAVTFQCSDSVDNADPEDTLMDLADPGCYDNGNVVTGNYVPGDNDETSVPACGNGAIDQLSEQCDDGNVTPGDGCSATCQTTVQCSDTVDNADPEDVLSDVGDPGCYDNGNTVTGSYVPGDNDETHVPACGNGALDQISEQCDDGNLVNGDGCSNTCQTTVQCSDGVDNADAEDAFVDSADPGCYDNGNVVTGTYVPGDNDETHAVACQNGALEGAEQCDDGNAVNTDACSNACTLPVCGDGITQVGNGEQCDDGNLVNGDGCNSTCQSEIPVCNGLVATIYVSGGLIVGGPDNGETYTGEIYATAGNDVIVTTGGNDQVYAEGGNDTICMLGGNDRAYGRSGTDWIDGGEGADRLYGEGDADTLIGSGGNDDLWGSSGNDILRGGAGADRLWGEAGNDTLQGGTEGDELRGDTGTDLLCAEAGNDFLWGELDNDTVDGGVGTDTQFGGAGTDTCAGGEANVGCESLVASPTPACAAL